MTPDILDAASIPLLAGIGLLAGIIAALMGIGGGLLITPFLNIVGVPLTAAAPTSMATIAVTSLGTTLKNRQTKTLDLRLGIVTAALMLPAVEASTWITKVLAGLDQGIVDGWMRLGFIAVLVASMLVVLRPPAESDAPRGPGPHVRLSSGKQVSFWYLLVGAIAAGCIGSLLGIGGGRILVPLFVGLLAVDLKQALATSSLVICLSACYAAISFFAKGLVDLPAVACLCSGSLVGSWIGATALARCGGGQLKSAYTLLSVAAIVALVLKHLGAAHSAFAVLLTTCVIIGIAALVIAARRIRPEPAP